MPALTGGPTPSPALCRTSYKLPEGRPTPAHPLRVLPDRAPRKSADRAIIGTLTVSRAAVAVSELGEAH
ncbi:hypothetical protein ACFYXF_30565 [Streptomyces sp. NPDC002680]|uniref:hypothetical protein n=1 Tax=Streptomyces sp. NPDC002680 TaxID=3364659 RepID=UPI0036ACAF9C